MPIHCIMVRLSPSTTEPTGPTAAASAPDEVGENQMAEAKDVPAQPRSPTVSEPKWEVISSLYEGFSSAIVDDGGPVMNTLAEVRDYKVAVMMASAPALYEALETAAAWFDEYAASHAAKETDDGREKAKRNEERASACRSALAQARGEQP